MILHVTELRNQIFKVFRLVDSGEEVTIIKKDSNRKYKIVPVTDASQPDIVKLAKEMGKIKLGLGSLTPKQIKQTLETKYD